MSTLCSVLMLSLAMWILLSLLAAGIIALGAVLLAMQIRRNKENDDPTFIINGIPDDGEGE